MSATSRTCEERLGTKLTGFSTTPEKYSRSPLSFSQHLCSPDLHGSPPSPIGYRHAIGVGHEVAAPPFEELQVVAAAGEPLHTAKTSQRSS